MNGSELEHSGAETGASPVAPSPIGSMDGRGHPTSNLSLIVNALVAGNQSVEIR